MPRTARQPRIRTATLALAVAAASLTGAALPAGAEGIEREPSATSTASDPVDDGSPSAEEAEARTQLEADLGADEPEVAPEQEEASVGAGPTGGAATEDAEDAAPATDPGALDRVQGGDRVATSLAVAEDRYAGGPRAAVLASAGDFADALAGSALADHVDGPLLLTDSARLDPRVSADLSESLAPGSTVWLLGGPEALDERVEADVAALGFATERLQGDDRYGTAAAIVREISGDGAQAREVILATGTSFADGASASGFASADRPLLFTRGDKLPPATAEQLAALAAGAEGRVSLTAVGGGAASAVGRRGAAFAAAFEVTTVVGEDRYQTSAELLTLMRGGGDEAAGPEEGAVEASGPVTLASGLDYADALIGGTYGHPVVLTEPEQLPPSVAEALGRLQEQLRGVLVVGGTDSVSDSTALAAAALAGGATATPEASAEAEALPEAEPSPEADESLEADEGAEAERSPEPVEEGRQPADEGVGAAPEGSTTTSAPPSSSPETSSAPEDAVPSAPSSSSSTSGATGSGRTLSPTSSGATRQPTTSPRTPIPARTPSATSAPASPTPERTPTPTGPAAREPEPTAPREPSPTSGSGSSSSSGAPDPTRSTSSTTGTPAPTSTAGSGSIDAEWRTAKASGSEARVRAFFAKWVDPDPVVRRTVTDDFRIDTQAEADAAKGTKFTGDGTISGGVTVRDAEFERGRVTVVDATLVDVLFDGADQTYKAWNVDFRGKADLTRVEFTRMQDAMKIDRERSDITARYVMIHQPSPEKGNLKGNNTHQDGAQVQAGSFDFQKGMLDYRGNHGGGQGMIFGGDSGRMGRLVIKDSFLTADQNMLTFQRRGPDRFPSSIDFGSVEAGDHNLVAPGPKMKNALSMYINAPVRMTRADQADITEHTFRGTNGATMQWKNGIRREQLS